MGDPNPYAYVRGQLLNAIDPTGLDGTGDVDEVRVTGPARELPAVPDSIGPSQFDPGMNGAALLSVMQMPDDYIFGHRDAQASTARSDCKGTKCHTSDVYNRGAGPSFRQVGAIVVEAWLERAQDEYTNLATALVTTAGPISDANAVRPGQAGNAAATGVQIVGSALVTAVVSKVGGALLGAGARAMGAGARTFTSADPLVSNLANAIERTHPGHVVGVNMPIVNSVGRVVTDADILLRNAVIQMKSGAGKGLTTQLLNTQAATTLPGIGYGPQLGGSLVRGIQANGGLVTRDTQLLIQVVAP